MRQLTEEQKAKSAERKARFREIAKRVAAMSDIEKAQMTQRIGAVVTCEGRALSLHNTLMLMLQIENVSMVGGFRQWLKAGRAVRKGEHGAMIWIRTGKKAEEPASERQEGIRMGLRMGLERAADIAKAHIGVASKTRPVKLGGLDPQIAQAIRGEERGEDIAAQEIHRKILAAIEKL